MSAECIAMPPDALWLWPKSIPDGVNDYLEIRHVFTVPAIGQLPKLRIAADSRYAVWINGVLIGTGPFPDWPGTRSVDEWDISSSLKLGKNNLAVLLYRMGEGTASYALGGCPGLIYDVSAEGTSMVVSDESAEWRRSPSYRSGPMPRITLQLPFTFDYDGTNHDGWQEAGYMPHGEWKAFTGEDARDCLDVGIKLRNRPLPCCVLRERLPATVVAQGVFKRAVPDESLAARMQRDWLSSRTAHELFQDVMQAPVPLTDAGVSLQTDTVADADGAYLLIDLGREAVGYLELEISSDSGALLEIAFGQHVDDLRVRSRIGARNFASSCRLSPGRQSFLYPITRLGCRYLQIHALGFSSQFTLYYAGLRELAYPIVARGSFFSGDGLKERIHAVSADTLRLCMHDHYDDTPWREQGLYANDMLNQSLAGYYAFGEYRFAQVSLELLGNGLQSDGILELCAPANLPMTIPSFTMAWVIALERNLRFSGDTAFAMSCFQKLESVITQWIAQISDGLLPSPTGARYWHFYDWETGGLDGTLEGDCTRFAVLNERRFDAPLNAFFIMGLEAASTLADTLVRPDQAAEWHGAAQSLRQEFHRQFWKAESGYYATFIGHKETEDCASELTQALAIVADCCPETEAGDLRRRMLKNHGELIPTTLSQSLYKFEAILQEPVLGPEIMNRIAEHWGGMLFKNATTFWETLKGGWDFDGAGSLCHGWSAIPAYIYGAYLLGIRPLEPGFRSFSVTPPVDGVCDGLSGKVPTPSGIIEITWTIEKGKPTAMLSYPPDLLPVSEKENCVIHHDKP